MKKLSLLLLLTIISLSSAAQFEYDTDSKQVQFAVDDIQATLSGLHKQDISIRFEIDPALGQPAYAITKRQGTVLVKGSDALGLMYGGLALAEQIRLSTSLEEIEECSDVPFIQQRGLKFNIPLDIQTPSYQDAGDEAQNNIAEMSNFEFWREYLDTMARHRYNVLTLWNPHPFPSMIVLEDYPDTWRYSVSFRTGSDVAASLSPTVGNPGGAVDGETGTFDIHASDPITQVSGGGIRDLGNPPYSPGSSWAALVTAGEPPLKPTPIPTGPVTTIEPNDPVSVYYDPNEAAIVFAAQDLKRILGKLGTVATLKPLSDLSGTPAGTYIVIAKSNADLQAKLNAAGGQAVGALGEQDYALRVTGSDNTKGYWALGGDRIGAMYGGFHIGEIVAAGSLANFQDEDKTPYIHKRGLKFNIPLDKRTPSFDDGGASAKTNRDDVWDLDFWKEYLDVIARQRFNVLSLWVRHPFPSIVKVPGYEDVALNDGVEGDNGKKINHYTIDEKIEHWRQVLEMAYDRGIECWFVTWNIHTHGTEHTSYNWSQEPEDEPYLDKSYKDYLKASVLAYFRTYPRMAGIGITAGENMRDKDDEGLPDDIREQWLWDTYGEAVMQIKNEDPSRKIRFVHRHWLSDYAEIADRFDRLPDGFEFSLKYSQARLYSSTNPPHAYKKLGKIANDKASWWNLRNDDIFIQRWGDPDFVKDFILNLPNEGAGCNRPPCITAGYVMGSDRYFWARESMSKNPQTPRQLENEKHWYKFLLWGRLGYDPYTSRDLLKGLIQYRFPTVNASKVFDAWQAASRIIPMVNRFHYLSWDYQWWVEKGTGNSYSDINGYHNINAIITYKSKDISTVPQDKYIYTSIEDFVKGDHYDTSPLVIADSLEADGNAALTAVAGMTGGSNIELKETLGDIRSQAHFGLYWAHKIRGGVELERFRNSKNNEHKDNAIKHLQKALGEWKNYAAQLNASYEKVRFSGHGVFDWDAITAEVKKDIEIARNVE